ncbi:GRB2-associated-binding protein 1 isoform X3 [Dromiciops gliroides]|uniref:GRB2-associated-binding protein 1 isoform X3 n=1 Tax=Dromiciops gliroides TaxID=33562 RepID=UPI001CC3C1B2|nr:GRB2-associated-binding protein 1 isoform X3 [Dromiciops gliroides]
MSGGEVVCSGWLRKSPPEKKLKRYAWKRRWFVLRSGRLTGDPDVLEYYKNDHAKKPIRIIDLNLCQQVDAGLTFNKKEFENSYIFDINTIDRIFYLVADSEEEMNKWVRCICDICGFNPTEEDPVKPPGSLQPSADFPLAVNPSPAPLQMDPSPGPLPPPYQLINLPPHLEPLPIQDDPQDYLLLINCQSKKLEPASQGSSFVSEEGEEYLLLEDFESKKIPLLPHADSAKSTSSETDCNDNVPSHKNSAPSQSKPAVNGFFQQQTMYDPLPPRAVSVSVDSNLYNLPRSYSHDVLPKTASPSSTEADGELYVFNTPSGTSSLETQMRQLSASYDIPPTPGNAYQIPRTFPDGALGQTSKLETIPDIPPPRPPKPHPAHDRSPVETCITRTASDTDSSYSIPTSGVPPSRSNTISTVDLNRLRKDASSQDSYDIPRTFPSDRSSSLEGFHAHLKNKNMLTMGSVSSEELDENYVPMNPNSPPRQHSSSFTEPIHEANYVPMTPGTFDFSSFGMQVPPPAHMGFRSSPKTPPRRPVPVADCEPPPVDRNLKPDRKVKPAPLEIKPLSEWEEFPAPVRSPITRSFARDSSRFPMSPRPDSVHSTTSSSDSHDSEENYVPMNPNLSSEDPNLFGSNSLDGGSSPMVKPKGDKQVEYLDLDLDSGKSTPPRKQKNSGSGSSVADERVDYVVVDQQKTLALKSTREAWTDGRQSTESETPTKSVK